MRGGHSKTAEPRFKRRRVMDVQVGDVLVMKKNHPCGGNTFDCLRSGMDFRLRCTQCGREFMIPRAKAEKNIRKILRGGIAVPRDPRKAD